MLNHYKSARSSSKAALRLNRGFTLVELMVALLLGIILIGGTISLYLNNQQSFRTTEAIAKVQENGRFAFELLSRDLRDAGSNPCALKAVTSVVRDASATIPWWANWSAGTVIGYNGDQSGGGAVVGTASGERVTATDAITVLRTSLDDGDLRTIQAYDFASTSITLNTVTGYAATTAALACDLNSGAIFDIWAVSNSLAQLDHQTSSPSMNCTALLGYPLQNDCTGGSTKTFAVGGFVTKLDSGFWYIGVNSRGTRSLYRHALTRSGSIITTEPREMVPDIEDMQIEYLTRDRTLTTNDLATAWIPASDNLFIDANGAWREMTIGSATRNNQEVVAVRITLTLVAPDGFSIEGVPLRRTAYGVIKLRNREVKS